MYNAESGRNEWYIWHRWMKNMRESHKIDNVLEWSETSFVLGQTEEMPVYMATCRFQWLYWASKFGEIGIISINVIENILCYCINGKGQRHTYDQPEHFIVSDDGCMRNNNMIWSWLRDDITIFFYCKHDNAIQTCLRSMTLLQRMLWPRAWHVL